MYCNTHERFHTDGCPPCLRESLAKAERELAECRTTMVAAAEEISEHWDAHCDEEGYGPCNLERRLREGIATLYPGYTLGAFRTLQAERDAAQAELAACREDALRYRWLRSAGREMLIDDLLEPHAIDAAIDTARAAEQEKPEHD